MSMLDWIRTRLDGPRARRLAAGARAAADARRVDEGLRLAAEAARADPALAEPHFLLGRLHELAGDLDAAEKAYRRAVALEPGHARACNNLGAVLVYRGRIDEALAAYRQALSLDPDQPEANRNLAILTQDPRAWEAAIRGFRRRVAEDPSDARAHASLADIYRGLGRVEDARASLERALALEPGDAEAHYGKAMLLLTAGDYAEGWREYEWRWRMDNQYAAPAKRFPAPPWDGRQVAGAVFLHGETALGELLQFVRYARLVAGRCERVVLEATAHARPLLETVEGVAQVVVQGDPLPRFAAHAPLFSLPRIFGTTLDNVPWDGPYVRADPARARECRGVVDAHAGGRRKVGLAWSGNPQNPHNRERSVDPRLLATLAALPGIAWYGLQAGPPAANPPPGMPLLDLAGRERDFLDAAAFVANLDLVLTIDTSIAHLAGAMGARTWVLLNRTPDWRFHLERADNPWYPTMRLFRQSREGDWSGPLAEVAEALAALG